ncbi:MAG: RodZ domain-containing protein [Pontixanthobacter sp.]
MDEEAELADTESTDGAPIDNGSTHIDAGTRLRTAREQAGTTIEQVASETRIPVRHLEVIESGQFEELPARTYAIGFSRTYARVVGLDEREIADQVRAELGQTRYHDAQQTHKFEPGDPARVPSRGLAWFSAFAVVLLLVGGFTFFRGYFFPGSGPGPITEPSQIAQSDRAVDADNTQLAPASDPTGAVVFIALEDDLWVKFYDAAGERLMEKQMAEGERYEVPANAEGPQVWTGQPEALAVTIGGNRIGTLSQESEIVRDIPATAAALVDRIEANEARATQTVGTGSVNTAADDNGAVG